MRRVSTDAEREALELIDTSAASGEPSRVVYSRALADVLGRLALNTQQSRYKLEFWGIDAQNRKWTVYLLVQ